MGILDDAIRQHLELKRRSGADPSAVAKLEHEAFGPIERRDALDVPDPAAPAEPSAELEAEAGWVQEHPATPAAALPVEPPVEPEPEVHAEPYEPAAQPFEPYDPATAQMPVEPAPPAPAAPPLAPDPEPRLAPEGERTVEFSVLDEEPDPQPDAEPGEHDELEETPEFLAETPEHDRLWFEQKPPRDFDF